MTTTITVPDENADTVFNAVAYTKGYTGWITQPIPPGAPGAPPEGIPGVPETKEEFFCRQITLWIQEQMTIAGKVNAYAQADQDVKNEVEAIPIDVLHEGDAGVGQPG